MDQIGRSTFSLAKAAIRQDRRSEAAGLIQYMRFEYLTIYEFLIGWKDDLLDYIGGKWGPTALRRSVAETPDALPILQLNSGSVLRRAAATTGVAQP
ncbi:MAG: hypothetical protein C4316_11415 [Chloroflexota bacterium]